MVEKLFAGLVSALILINIAIHSGYITPIYFTGDSMEPTLHEPSFLLCVRDDEYNIGDIVVFESSAYTDELITHRIIRDTSQGYVTKGDGKDKRDIGYRQPEDIKCEIL